MPRKSAAASAITTASSGATRLKPPPSLPEPERRIFRDLVASCASDHFRQSDLPLLARYVEAIDLAERAAKELRKNPVSGGKISPWVIIQEKCARTIIALSMRLRLSPQARRNNAPKNTPSEPLNYYERQRLRRLDNGGDYDEG